LGVVGEGMKEYLKKMKFSAFFLLACGSVVRNPEALEGLKKVANE